MRYGVALGALRAAPQRARYARKAQDAGFDSAWSSDNPGEDAIVHMTAMAAAAPGIHVGSGILRAFLRHPVTIASAPGPPPLAGMASCLQRVRPSPAYRVGWCQQVAL